MRVGVKAPAMARVTGALARRGEHLRQRLIAHRRRMTRGQRFSSSGDETDDGALAPAPFLIERQR